MRILGPVRHWSSHRLPVRTTVSVSPWPSFVSDIKQEAAHRAANPDGKDFQVPVDCADDLLGVLELSFKDKETHWKHGGIVGVFGYGGGVIGRYCDQPEQFPGVAHFHTVRVAQPSGKYYTSDYLRSIMAGVFPLTTSLCARPQGLGYSLARVTVPNPFHPVGTLLHGHEFHYSKCLPSLENDPTPSQPKADGFCLTMSSACLPRRKKTRTLASASRKSIHSKPSALKSRSCKAGSVR